MLASTSVENDDGKVGNGGWVICAHAAAKHDTTNTRDQTIICLILAVPSVLTQCYQIHTVHSGAVLRLLLDQLSTAGTVSRILEKKNTQPLAGSPVSPTH
eukprot:scpid69604/ scgid18061/ 